MKKNTGREKLGKEAYDNTANMVEGFILDNVDITEYAFAGAIPIIVEGLAEAAVATGVAKVMADALTDILKEGLLTKDQKIGLLVLKLEAIHYGIGCIPKEGRQVNMTTE